MESSATLAAIEQAAATWLLKRDGERWSAADQAELDQWLQASPAHRVSYIRLQSVWRNADRLKSISAGLPKGEVPPRGAIERSPYFAIKRGEFTDSRPENTQTFGVTPERGSSSNANPVPSFLAKNRLFALAASILLTAGLAFTAYNTFIDHGTTYTTPVGGLTTIATDDGSTITLNTDTEIKVDYTDHARHIKLKRGEAFFEVAHDPTRPFTVAANDERVVAVGTKFSVRVVEPSPSRAMSLFMRAEGAIRVVVTEGKVRIEGRPGLLDLARLSASRTGNASIPETPDGGTIKTGEETTLANSFLSAGSTADVNDDRVSIQQRPIPQIEQSLSWRTGYVVLQKAPLPDAVAEFNRYNTRQLVIEDSSLDNIIVGGNFRSNNLDGFVRLLEQGFDIQAEFQSAQIVLKRRARAVQTDEP